MTSETIDFKLINQFVNGLMKALDDSHREHESLGIFYADEAELCIEGSIYQYKGSVQVVHALLVSHE
jgi:hypothetical protein